MKITGITAHEVGIPMQGTLLWAYSFSGHGYTDHVGIAHPRTILEVHTDEGLTGIGEGQGSKEYFETEVAEGLRGTDPFDWKRLIAPVENLSDRAGLEFAMWDLMGKHIGKPAAALVNGGAYEPTVEWAAYVFFRAPGVLGGGEVNLENYAGHVKDLVDRHGFRSVKLKLGVYRPEEEIGAVKRTREALGPGPQLRLDPNSAWAYDETMLVVRELGNAGIEYFEDVARGIELQARLRQETDIPVCVDGSYSLDRLANVIRAGAGDVVMTDIYGSGGIAGMRDWVSMARAFGLKVSCHSGRWLGVSHMAKLHAAAAAGPLDFAVDGHYHQLSDDVLKGGLLKYGPNGTMDVPDKPGLGIELDPERLEKYRYTPERKAEYARFHEQLQKAHGRLGYGDYKAYMDEHIIPGGKR